MTGHFTTLDKCERWASIAGAPEFMRVPYSTCIPYTDDHPLTISQQMYGCRMYKLERINYSRGLAEYVEVYI